VNLKPGSLYATLDRLQDEGLVEDAGEEIVAGRLRRYYTLTGKGAEALEKEIGRLESNAHAARMSLRARTAGGLA
jgi:PadR family transcriptional regulator, regulatory protein PadR